MGGQVVSSATRSCVLCGVVFSCLVRCHFLYSQRSSATLAAGIKHSAVPLLAFLSANYMRSVGCHDPIAPFGLGLVHGGIASMN